VIGPLTCGQDHPPFKSTHRQSRRCKKIAAAWITEHC
jgi:hypothetical protein